MFLRKKKLEIKLVNAPKAEETTPTNHRLTDSELEAAKSAVVGGLAFLLLKTVVECGSEIAIANIKAK